MSSVPPPLNMNLYCFHLLISNFQTIYLFKTACIGLLALSSIE
jgi:hypothetical protein